MTKANKIVLVVLMILFVGVGVFTVSVLYAGHSDVTQMEASEEIYDVAMGFFESSRTESAEDSSIDNVGFGASGEYEEPVRLTQRVTVFNEAGILPYSGTIAKTQDAFYPGTYNISFSSNAIMTSEVTIRINMNVRKGEKVYVLTGNKDDGYREYAVIDVVDDNKVEFSTMVLQNYTVSTTDISSAQEAMAVIVGN